jgi:hypothetical protein
MSDARPGDGGREIVLRDEVLELLYWFEGEGFHGHATIAGMMRFLAFSEREIGEAVAQLVTRGDLIECGDGMFRLSAEGHREAARRFADDFGPLLHQGHGECNDPSCECHTDPSGAAECHGRTAHGSPDGSSG